MPLQTREGRRRRRRRRRKHECTRL